MTKIKKPVKSNEPRRLYRSREDKVIAGVCGGIADYFNVDPVWIRLAAVLLFFANGIGLIAYIVGWILIPENPNQKTEKKTVAEETVEKFHHEARMVNKKEKGSGTVLIGTIIVIIGAVLFLKQFFGWLSWDLIWPAAIIVLGIFLLMRDKK